MQVAERFAELSGSELLDEVELLHASQRRTEVLILKAAVRHADLNTADTLDPAHAQLPGRERAVQLGGEGTPEVREFAPAELGARLQLSSYAAGRLMADGLDLRHRLPRLWKRVEALEVRVGHARYVARRTRDLTAQQAAFVDDRVAESADGRLTWTRFTDLVEAMIVASDPVAAAEREQAAAQAQFATPTRSTDHGMRGFYIRAPFPVIARIDATVAYLADALLALGDTATLDQRRVKAMLIMANPTEAVQILQAYAKCRAGVDRTDPVDLSRLLPTVRLFVHLAQDASTSPTREQGVARVEGLGPVSPAWVKQHLGDCRFTITPVLDLAGQAPVDAWEIPDRHRRAVHLMTPADTFPFSSSTSRTMQIDHSVPYVPQGSGDQAGGQSRVGNYGPMTTAHHRIKTHGGWQVKQPFPGIYVWRDPHGACYLVDHTGTRRIGRAGRAGPGPASTAEVYFSQIILEFAA